MTYAIVRKDNPTKVILDVEDYPHLYNDREFAEDVCALMGDAYKVVPW